MVAVVWVPDVALVVVFRPFGSTFVAVVENDAAVATGGSGRETRGWAVCGGVVSCLGRVWRRFREFWASFGAGDAAVVDIVDVVGVVDGGCACVDGGDVAVSEGSGGSVTMLLGGSVDIPAFLRSRDGSLSVGAVWTAADRRFGVPFVCEAVSAVLGAAWVVASVVVRIRGVDAFREAQRPSPWFNTQPSFSSFCPSFFPSS